MLSQRLEPFAVTETALPPDLFRRGLAKLVWVVGLRTVPSMIISCCELMVCG